MSPEDWTARAERMEVHHRADALDVAIADEMAAAAAAPPPHVGIQGQTVVFEGRIGGEAPHVRRMAAVHEGDDWRLSSFLDGERQFVLKMRGPVATAVGEPRSWRDPSKVLAAILRIAAIATSRKPTGAAREWAMGAVALCDEDGSIADMTRPIAISTPRLAPSTGAPVRMSVELPAFDVRMPSPFTGMEVSSRFFATLDQDRRDRAYAWIERLKTVAPVCLSVEWDPESPRIVALDAYGIAHTPRLDPLERMRATARMMDRLGKDGLTPV